MLGLRDIYHAGQDFSLTGIVATLEKNRTAVTVGREEIRKHKRAHLGIPDSPVILALGILKRFLEGKSVWTSHKNLV